MSSRLTHDTLYKMDSMLNRELGRIDSRLNSPSFLDRDTNRFLLVSTDTIKSAHTGAHHSRKSSIAGSPRVTFKDTLQVADYPVEHSVETDINFKMQKQLLILQARVIELEMKLTSANSPALPDQAKKAYTPTNNASLANTMESSKLNSYNGSPVSRNREAELKPSWRNTVNNQERTALQSNISPILQQDNLGISSISHRGSAGRILVRSPSGLSAHTVQTAGKSTAKSSIKRELKVECDSNMSGVSNAMSKMNYSATSRSNMSKREKENMSRMQLECEEENVDLRKLINRYKREYNEDKAALVKERVRGNQLAEELEKINKKMKKLEKAIGTAVKSQSNYGDLVESFNKSENIRKQQRSMIDSLNEEVRLLKGETEFSQERSFKTESSSTRNTGKAKRKTAKAF